MGSHPISKSAKKNFQADITVILDDDIDSIYEVSAKDFQPGLLTTWYDPDDNNKKKTITWISNFQIKRGGNAIHKLDDGRKYKVDLPKYPGKYVYFDESATGNNRIRQATIIQNSGNSVQIELDLADPPIGWG